MAKDSSKEVKRIRLPKKKKVANKPIEGESLLDIHWRRWITGSYKP